MNTSKINFPEESEFNEKVWGLDLGTGSLGIAVREGLNFLNVSSDLIPAEFAEIKTAALLRRQWRTRVAHKARENWLDSCLSEMGMDVLGRRKISKDGGVWKVSQKGDPRLEREFPCAGDDTCYNSIALRCKLLLGHKLEKWQIYKALSSAIQLRGYDENIPWLSSPKSEMQKSENDKLDKNADEKAKKEKQEQKETLEKIAKFSEALENMTPFEEFHYPAFFKAWKMGLWSPSNPEDIKVRIDFNAERAAGYTMPRYIVEKEFLKLVEMAALQYPCFKGKGMYLLYGPSENAYASYFPEKRKKFNLKRGVESDWRGVLGQKIPRFDNRIIDKCCLIPRLNVCKIKDLKNAKSDADYLPYEISFGMKLLNVRFMALSDNSVRGLSFEEFQAAFEEGKKHGFKFTETQWKKFLSKMGFAPIPGHDKIEEPRSSGRASFSRPAMKIMKELLLSGKAPKEFYEDKKSKIKNSDPQKGIVVEDLDFIARMGECDWNRIYLPDLKIRTFLNISPEERDSQIRKLIGNQNDPIVRHRLFNFYETVKSLEKKYGVPDKVVLEFVREDFMSAKKKAAFEKINKENRAIRKNAAAHLDEAEIKGGKKLLLKYILLNAQGGKCMYTDEALEYTNLESYEIEHIVPRAKGGPDAMFNYVLTTRKTNLEKGERTPYEWLRSSGKWQAYVDRVRSQFNKLGKKRCELLTSENASELVEKYTTLAETAWIAKLAQSILAIHFAWGMGGEIGERKIFVASGGLTARFRGAYKLNDLLLSDSDFETLEKLKNSSYSDYVNLRENLDKKNRKNKRHHALDAMVLTFASDYMKASRKRKAFVFPEKIEKNAKEFFGKYLQEVIPQYVAFEKAKLEETIYGERNIGSSKIAVVRRLVADLAYKSVNMKKVFELDSLFKGAEKILDKPIKEKILAFAETSPTEEEWLKWCSEFRTSRKNGGTGALVKRVVCRVGDTAEYKDLSKDSCGGLRKGKAHKGQIIWENQKGKFVVQPVYAHASKAKVYKELQTRPEFKRVVDFFQTKCLVKLDKDVMRGETLLCKAGVYTLNTIMTVGKAKLTSSSGVPTPEMSIKYLIPSGFSRIKS